MLGVFSNSLLQALKVAPVVSTSSINRMCLFAKIVMSSGENFISLFSNLSNPCLKVCVFVAKLNPTATLICSEINENFDNTLP